MAEYFANPGFDKRLTVAQAELEDDSDLDDELDERALFVDDVPMDTLADRLRIYERYNDIRIEMEFPDAFSENKVVAICRRLLREKVTQSKRVVAGAGGNPKYLEKKTLERYLFDILETVSQMIFVDACLLTDRRCLVTSIPEHTRPKVGEQCKTT